MPTRRSPRRGSLQFWPRKRAKKFLPRVNWDALNSSKNLKGFITYKAGMKSLIVSDKTPNSMTKGKKIAIPVTILECPPMKILSVRLYKSNIVKKEIINDNLDKELKKRLKLPKKRENKALGELEAIKIEEYGDLKAIFYSVVKKTNIKKSPDLAEIGFSSDLQTKINFVKENLNKEITITNVFEKNNLVDVKGLTKGKGFSGPVKRFGIKLRPHKTEKGRRRPGSLGPWHPARVTFRVPMAGQLGMFTRTTYNNKIVDLGKSENNKFTNIKNFGDIKTDYLILTGSIPGPSKRPLLVTTPVRPTKKQIKKILEVQQEK